MGSAAEIPETRQYLAFTLAGGEYAVEIREVKEILQFGELTKVPSTPRSIRGVLNLRGSVVPVVDLPVKFGLPETAITNRTCVLVVETEIQGAPAVMGLLADAVSEVIELGAEEVEEPPAFGTGVRVEYLVGMGKVGRRLVLLLDVHRVLSADEREIAAAAARGEGLAAEGEPSMGAGAQPADASPPAAT